MMAALHATAHAHIDIVPNICTLTCTFCLARSLDNRGWTVLQFSRCIFLTSNCKPDGGVGIISMSVDSHRKTYTVLHRCIAWPCAWPRRKKAAYCSIISAVYSCTLILEMPCGMVDVTDTADCVNFLMK